MAGKDADFDLGAAHKRFAANCFNKAWDFIDRAHPTAVEEDEMIQLAVASAWHWSQRPDRTPKNQSLSYWQMSRVMALVGDAFLAERFAKTSLEVAVANDLGPFLIGYANEALARAAKVKGDRIQARRYVARAREAEQKVESSDDRQLLGDDLSQLEREL